MNLLQNSSYKISRPVAVGLLITTAVLWSFGGLLIKMVSWNPIAIAGMRSAISSLLILLVMGKPRFNWSFTQISCAVAYAATVTLFVAANKMTTAANAILLQYTAPIYVAIFGVWFLKEKAKIYDWITIGLVLAGMVLFFFDHLTPGGLYGNILAILSGLAFAFLVLLMRKQKDTSSLESLFLGNVATALIGLPFMFGSMPDARSWVGLVLLGVFQLGLSYICYSIAIKHVTAIEGILIPVIEPILNPIWVFLFLDEAPGPWALLGGFIVVVSITLRCIITSIRSEPQKVYDKTVQKSA